MNAVLLSAFLLLPAADPVGTLPVGADGKPLNLDFETGTLKDWTATGDAFRDQPILGDTVEPRRPGMKSDHQGRYWIGGYEKLSDKPTGTLTSVPFTVTQPWASFLIGGGPHTLETCVELVVLPRNEVFFRASGVEEENLRRVVVDLSKVQGKQIQIRLVDRHTGHWGHLNFDDFRFHEQKPTFANEQRRPAPPAKADDYKYAGQPPLEAAKNMTVPPGFSVSLVAGEPDLHQPIAFCFDDRGRLWVLEAYCYPRRKPFEGPLLPADKRKEGDKILIFEDVDGDGKFDKKTVFLEGLNLASGIELGFGGVWVGAAPYFLFIPLLEGDKPGEPKILLDGWGYQDTHETLNSFIWGPDGWLYGCHGVFTHSRVGKPGTPDAERIPINAGIWRYHPTRHEFEVFAHGTSNPWGLDYNPVGEFFIEACVIPHLWHIVQGGRYERQAGQHFNPFTYDAQIKTIAKHRHYVGATPHSGNGRSDSAGGGHAHSGLICYQGGVWPKEYHGKLFMGNLHGHRINVDVVQPKGASYEGDRNPDFLLSHDRHCIIVALRTGPDGNVYFSDWSDKQVCHRNEPEIWDRTNGRLFRISHKDARPVVGLDLQKLSTEELVKLVISDNEWMSRHARRILQERGGKSGSAALEEMARKNPDPTRRLRALWTLANTEGVSDRVVMASLTDSDDAVRAWAIRLAFDRSDRTTMFPLIGTLTSMAKGDKSPVVRRTIAGLLSRLPLKNRPADDRLVIVQGLISHAEDATDPVLPTLYWSIVEPLVAENPARALKVVAEGKIPALLDWSARRAGAVGTPEAVNALVEGLSQPNMTPQAQIAYLQGLKEAGKGKRQATMPTGWSAIFAKLSLSASPEVRAQALALAVTYGDQTAFAQFRKIVAEPKEALPIRLSALTALLEARDPELVPILQQSMTDADLRSAAIRGLAAFDDAKTPAVLVKAYPQLSAEEKRLAIATLASRATFAGTLLDAIAAKTIPAADVPAETIRQLRTLGVKSLDERIVAVWGTVRDTPADRKKLIADWTKKLTAPGQVDLGHGRAVFARVCQQCHTLYGVGGKVGPDITGSNRADPAYLLENVFDPSAVIPKEYAATKIDLIDGRSIVGIIKEETPTTIAVMTATETLTLPTKDVEKRTPSPLSMMPDDLTRQLTEPELKALFAYLRHPSQVPLLASADNARDFFNGKDLTGWDGDRSLWSVENGEIVGRSKTGLKRNEFLKSTMEVTDFRLTVKVKLTPNKENSGIQFRSEPLPGGEMKGPQADAGAGWWGKLYEESGRGLLWKESGEKHVKPDDWNEYVIEAIGPRVRTWINGQLCVDLQDEALSRRGVFGLQLHSGGPLEVRFKELKLEVLPRK